MIYREDLINVQKQQTVSLCMIVKNEEDYLKACLSSVKDIVDEMIIVDTGSTDKTVEIAKSFSAKVFHYKWDSNFSKARNFSLSKATCDWILILDADEIFEKTDTDKFIELINTTSADGCHFMVINYSSNQSVANASVHYAFRLLRNTKAYHYVGSIHEQITRIDGDTSKINLTNEEIKLHHYGYMDQVIEKKGKRSRNLPIIMKQLEQDPHNAFYLFNLGNEYLASNNHAKALEIYKEAKKYIILNQSFVPHLFYRMMMCSYVLKLYPEALALADEALVLFPSCTDIEYYKGTILYNLHRYTLAIKSFERCLEIGEPPAYFKLATGSGTFRPYLSLGDIYTTLEDFDKAIECYSKVIQLDASLCHILYQIGHVLTKKYGHTNEVPATIRSYFSSLEYLPNLLLYTDVLIQEGFYDLALEYTTKMKGATDYPLDRLYLRSKLYFFQGDYALAAKSFETLLQMPPSFAILPELKLTAMKYLFTTYTLLPKANFAKVLASLKEADPHIGKVYLELYNLYAKVDAPYVLTEGDSNLYVAIIMDFLDRLLKIKEFDLFEQFLYVLNRVESKDVLMALAKLYYNNDFKEMATKTIFKSIKEFDRIDHECLNILAHLI